MGEVKDSASLISLRTEVYAHALSVSILQSFLSSLAISAKFE